jgi:hypothetical protein
MAMHAWQDARMHATQRESSDAAAAPDDPLAVTIPRLADRDGRRT